MSSDLIRQLKTLKHADVKPREAWLKSNRALLLSQIKNTVSAGEQSGKPSKLIENFWAGLSIFMPRTVVYNVVRPIAILLVVALVGTSGWIATGDASYQTLPGDLLYPAKRAAEKTQVAVVSIIGNNNDQAKLHTNLATKRAMETNRMINSNDPKKIKKVSGAVADLKEEINTINAKLEITKTPNGEKIQADVAKDITQQTEQIKNVLQDAKVNLLVSPAAENKELSKEIKELSNSVDTVSLKAMKVMVDGHVGGDSTMSEKEVKQVINNSLEKVASEMNESKQTVKGAQAMVETAKTEVKGLTAVKNADPLAVGTTKEFADKISTVANQTKEAATTVTNQTAEVDKKISEAKVLLVNGDLTKAVDKVAEATQVSKEVKQISDTTLEQTQNVLPIVQVMKEASGSLTPTASGTPLFSGTASGSLPLIPLISGMATSGTSSISTSGSTTPSVVSNTPKL